MTFRLDFFHLLYHRVSVSLSSCPAPPHLDRPIRISNHHRQMALIAVDGTIPFPGVDIPIKCRLLGLLVTGSIQIHVKFPKVIDGSLWNVSNHLDFLFFNVCFHMSMWKLFLLVSLCGIASERFTVVSYNILGDRNSSHHRDLYSNVSFPYLKWGYRKRLICEELIRLQPDIICMQVIIHSFLLFLDSIGLSVMLISL